MIPAEVILADTLMPALCYGMVAHMYLDSWWYATSPDDPVLEISLRSRTPSLRRKRHGGFQWLQICAMESSWRASNM